MDWDSLGFGLKDVAGVSGAALGLLCAHKTRACLGPGSDAARASSMAQLRCGNSTYTACSFKPSWPTAQLLKP